MVVVKGTGASASPHYLATDHLTGSNVVTNSSGAQEELMDYYPFGAIRLDEKVGTFTEQRKFIGQEYDTDTGLNYLNARYYNSSTGRFLSEDSEFWALNEDYFTNPQLWNSYSYAANNPITGSDPTGPEENKADVSAAYLRFLNCYRLKFGEPPADNGPPELTERMG